MINSKIIDCITFFDENYIFDFRYNVLKENVDTFVVCESTFDHKGREKKINFNLDNRYSEKKVKHIILQKPFPKINNEWENQAIQREFILENINFANDEDYIFFSDPDEIPNPNILKNFKLNKKYGIFMQNFYNYKFNLFNKYETPWQGTRVCKKKNLKSIDFMRQKVKKKNQEYSFFRIDKERSVEVFSDAGWHFNNLMTPNEISKKLKSFAHIEYDREEFTSPDKIKEKIENKIDLFNRSQKYDVVEVDEKFPKYLQKNLDKFKKFII
tara:strand:+ start:660 stop:1469 length:810 start_codon:yes stop_codon:yes gene_type:complete